MASAVSLTSNAAPVADTVSDVTHAIVLPPMSVEGRINVTDKPEIFVKAYTDATLLHITTEANMGKADVLSIDVDIRALINAKDKTHDAPIPADVFKGTVDGVHAPTGRFQYPTEEGSTPHKEKLSGIKRSIDEMGEDSPVKATPTASLPPPPPSPMEATPSPTAPSSQPPKINRT